MSERTLGNVLDEISDAVTELEETGIIQMPDENPVWDNKPRFMICWDYAGNAVINKVCYIAPKGTKVRFGDTVKDPVICADGEKYEVCSELPEMYKKPYSIDDLKRIGEEKGFGNHFIEWNGDDVTGTYYPDCVKVEGFNYDSRDMANWYRFPDGSELRYLCSTKEQLAEFGE